MTVQVLPRRLRTFARTPWHAKVAWAEATVLFWFFTVALKIVPFRRFKGLIGPAGQLDDPVGRQAVMEAAPADVVAIARWMGRISTNHPDTCLAQALAGRTMLHRRGLPSTLSFGVKKDEGAHKFHAWLVYDERVITGGGALPAFTVISTHHDLAPS